MCPQTAPEVTSALLNDSTGGLKSRMPSSLLMVGFTGPLRLHAQIKGATLKIQLCILLFLGHTPASPPNNITAAAFMLVCWSAARKRPWLTQNLTNQAVNSSSTLKLECDALGVPRPEITWYKNEVLLKQSPGNLNISFQKDICRPFSIILTPRPVWTNGHTLNRDLFDHRDHAGGGRGSDHR